jgi:hypothetical protein
MNELTRFASLCREQCLERSRVDFLPKNQDQGRDESDSQTEGGSHQPKFEFPDRLLQVSHLEDAEDSNDAKACRFNAHR